MLMAGFVLFFTQSATAIPGSEERTVTETDPIDLKGELDPGSGLRSGGDVITAEVQGSSAIMATFHRNLGNVLVTLTNGQGDTVYVVTVNTSVQQQAFIPLSGLLPGIYTITFSNEHGALYGDFEI